jgi:MYXO-CTERM domain-containing protein
MTAEATSEAGAPVQYPEATANDTVSAVSLAYSPASGSTLPLGTTDVQVTATDGAGNASSCTLAVTVRDTTPPRVGCPGPLTAEAQDATGASVAYSTPAPFDEVTRAPTISASHAPGSRFPLGTTEVTLTATDAANNAASCSFSVTVRDTTAPALACPASVTVASTLEEEVVDYPAATASDAVTAPLVVSYSHPSGGRFPKGTTRVTASTVDGAGLRSDCSFDVTVREPPPSSTHVNAVATLGCAASGAGGNSGLALWLLLGAGTLWSRRRRTPAAPAR